MATTYDVITTNGEHIAHLVGGIYLNRHSHGSKIFMDTMAAQNEKIQYNFTLLCAEWFRRLSEVNCYDDRNEASVMLGKRLVAQFPFEELPYKKRLGKDAPAQITLNYDDGSAVAQALAAYLTLCAPDYDAFLKTMLYEHKTLQQNFSRLCVKWLKGLADRERKLQREEKKLTEAMSSLDTGLPYI